MNLNSLSNDGPGQTGSAAVPKPARTSPQDDLSSKLRPDPPSAAAAGGTWSQNTSPGDGSGGGDLTKIALLSSEAVQKAAESLKKSPKQGKPKADKEGQEVAKKPKRKTWKKPKDKPKRPLSAYNLFFQEERARMVGQMGEPEGLEDSSGTKRLHRKSHGKIGFAEMARVIGSKWKTLRDEEKTGFEEEAKKEKKRYEVELKAWQEARKRKSEASAYGPDPSFIDPMELAALRQKRILAATLGQGSSMQGFGMGMGLGTASMAGADSTASGTNASSSPALAAMIAERDALLQRRKELQQRQQLSQMQYLRILEEQAALDRSMVSGGGGWNSSASLRDETSMYPSASAASASAIMQMQQQRQMQMQQPFMNAGSSLGSSGVGLEQELAERNRREYLQVMQQAAAARQRQQSQSQMEGGMGFGNSGSRFDNLYRGL